MRVHKQFGGTRSEFVGKLRALCEAGGVTGLAGAGGAGGPAGSGGVDEKRISKSTDDIADESDMTNTQVTMAMIRTDRSTQNTNLSRGSIWKRILTLDSREGMLQFLEMYSIEL